MAIQHLVKVDVVGTAGSYHLAEDALSALKCLEVTAVQRAPRHFVIEGWLPRPWYEDLRDMLEEASHGKVALVWDKDVTPVAAPVLLENPRLVRPYEALVELFSLPGREGYDPTFLTFLALPMFFGFMIGDVGYGAAFLAAGWVLRHRVSTPMAELASSFLTLGGVWSIVFGAVLFAEFFGFEVEAGPFRYHLLDRLQDVGALLWLSIGIGLAHLNLGLAIGLWYERRRAGLRLAALRKASWFVLEAGLLLLGVAALGFAAAPLWAPGLAAVALAVVLISYGGGLTDVIEVPGFVSNILSYLRLGVLGLAKAIFSVGVNAVVLSLAPYGPGGWALGAIIFVLGHAFIMGLALLTVSIQALRLLYVEFYTKVYRAEDLGAVLAFHPTTHLPGA